MNYRLIYEKIIDRYRSNPPDVGDKHHIVPKSLGGSNKKSNIVLLPHRAHFVCHMLLVKMHEGKAKSKMIYALWRMSNSKRYIAITSKQYEIARIKFAEHIRNDAREYQLNLVKVGKHPWQGKESGERVRKREIQLVKDGIHPFLNGEIQRKTNALRVEAGIHHWQDSEKARERAKKRVSDGTHHFLDKEAASRRSLQRIKNGTHPFVGGELTRKRVLEGTHNWVGGVEQRKRVDNGTHHLLVGEIQKTYWLNLSKEERTKRNSHLNVVRWNNPENRTKASITQKRRRALERQRKGTSRPGDEELLRGKDV